MILFVSCHLSFAQTSLGKGKGYLVYSKVTDGDTLPVIFLQEITIMPPFQFKNKLEILKYEKLIRNIKKAYPYAKIARNELKTINENLKTIKSESDKKIYLKEEEKKLRAQFGEDLKKLTVTQGKILIKLIDRETGSTTYELIKELKGSFTAFLYQSVAVIFGSTLKYEYDSSGEDKMIEDIVIRIENGQL